MRFRQVHLDFHTSEKVPGVGSRFDKKQFQAALIAGHVDSITLFAKCHHGCFYYPSKVSPMHPSLTFDLLRAQLDACAEIGVQAPVYISAGFDELAAEEHPEWLMRKSDESIGGANFVDRACYKLLCFNTGYLDKLVAEVEEVMQRYNPCEVFLDISAVRQCHCSACRKRMRELGYPAGSQEGAKVVGEENFKKYAEAMKAAVHKYNPNTAIYHNGGHLTIGKRYIADYNGHQELESLPTGGWGYDHFPLSASYCRTVYKDYLGMTGKFHTSWGDFGGFKHPNALRWEVSLDLAMGAKISVGDQLHPSGEMNMHTYNIIGAAFKEVEEKEPWCDHVTAVADVAVLADERYGRVPNKTPDPLVGINRILLEGKYLYDILDVYGDLEKYKVIIVPENIRPEPQLAEKLQKHLAKGGKILAAGTGGLYFDKDEFCIDLGVSYKGVAECNPNYFVPGNELNIPKTEYVMYSNGYEIEKTAGKTVGFAQESYFNRTPEHFCSHRQTPNNPDAPLTDGVVLTHNTAYVAWDIFTEYAFRGTLFCKQTVCGLLDALLGDEKTLKTNLPDKAIVSLMHQPEQNRLVQHSVYAHTTLRGKAVEVIEDVVPLYNVEVALRLDAAPKKVYLAPSGESLPFAYADGLLNYTVPKVDIHAMAVIDL